MIGRKKKLSPERLKVLLGGGTEEPWTGRLLYEKRSGLYSCAFCGNPIFQSESKFDSGTGWPSFDRVIPGSVKLSEDRTGSQIRTEVRCANCSCHLGHLFSDGPTETGARYCVNSASLEFEEKSPPGGGL